MNPNPKPPVAPATTIRDGRQACELRRELDQLPTATPTNQQLQDVAQAAAQLHDDDRVREVIGRCVAAGMKPTIANVPAEKRQALFFELDMLANPGEVYVPAGAVPENPVAAIPVALAPAFCSGTGQYHTDEPGKKTRKPYSPLTFVEIQTMIDNPPSVDKSIGRWFIPSTLLSRTFSRQETEGQFGVLAADLDKDPRPLAEVADLVRGIVGGRNFEVYATRSAKEDKQKGRILIELPRLVDHATIEALQLVLADKLLEHGIEVDQALMRPGQLVYLPNRGEFYVAHHERNAGVFDAEEAWADEIAAKQAARAVAEAKAKAESEARAQARAARLAEVEGDTSKLGPIERYNAVTDVSVLLLNHGYEEDPRKPGNWRHPASESGNYSLQVTEAGGVYGLSSEDLLGAAKNGGHALSPFDVLTKLEFDGDEAAARASVGCRVSQSAAEAFAGFGDPVVGSEPTTAHEVLGELVLNNTDVKGAMDAEQLIPGVIVRGHVGVYPSPPGGGKTTLFIHFCEALAGMGFTIYYFNLDSPPEMLAFQLAHAQQHGYHLIAPDMKKGKSAKDAIAALVKLARLPASTLKSTVFILDTLKKFANLLSKEQVAAFFKLVRAINSKGATVCILGHTNKYLDQEGNLVFEGVGDVMSDVDELIYLYSSLDHEANIRDITTDFSTGKVRAKGFAQRSFRIHLSEDPRRVEECATLLPRFTDESRKVLKVASEVLGTGSMVQRDLIAALLEYTPYGRDKIRTALHQLSENENSPLKTKRDRNNNNALLFSVRDTSVGPSSYNPFA